ncbi:hypothetical protein [Lysobacter gummosus]|uniref:hypothetical protein n=1 Tax=Lysobacter gummosus TaxID=262324 RepID=UPI00362E7787
MAGSGDSADFRRRAGAATRPKGAPSLDCGHPGPYSRLGFVRPAGAPGTDGGARRYNPSSWPYTRQFEGISWHAASIKSSWSATSVTIRRPSTPRAAWP